MLRPCFMSYKISTIEVFDRQARQLAKHYPSFRERVNGVVTNTDDWYDLFDVKPTDKLYLAPVKRIRIW